MATTTLKAGMVWKGAYDASVTYDKLDVVCNADKTQIAVCKQGGTGIPLTNSNYWEVSIDASGIIALLEDALAHGEIYTMKIGSVTTGASSSATIVNNHQTHETILNLVLEKGEKGTSDFVIVDDHSGAGDDPNKIYIPSANAEKENAIAIANEVTRATEAEQTNATAIATEEARARAAEQTNATAIAAEEARARAAEADRYTKSETYTKTEVNDLVDTPHQEYVTVDAYSNLPATGSKDTIYRVSNYNGSTSQVDITSYSEYAWNGSSYTFLCVKSQIGEVFDISVYKNNTKYADLAAALNGGANIPQSLQKGGMSVKFVRSSDNKYVHFDFLLSGTFTTAQFTNPDNWQGVDDELTHGSNNLAKSGNVVKNITPIINNIQSAISNKNTDIEYTQQSTDKDIFVNWGVNTGETVKRTNVSATGEGIYIIGENTDGEIEILTSGIFGTEGQAVAQKDYIRVGIRVRANDGSKTINLSCSTFYSQEQERFQNIEDEIQTNEQKIDENANNVFKCLSIIDERDKTLTFEQSNDSVTKWYGFGGSSGQTVLFKADIGSGNGFHLVGKTQNNEVVPIGGYVFVNTNWQERILGADYKELGIEIHKSPQEQDICVKVSNMASDVEDLKVKSQELENEVSELEADRNLYKDITKEVTTVQQSTQQTIWLGISAKTSQYFIVNGTSGANGTRLRGKKSDNTEEWLGSGYNFTGWNNQRVDITSDYVNIGFWSNGNNPSVSVTITLVSNLGDVERRLDVVDSLLPVTKIDSFNFVKNNRERISLFLGMYKLKAVDKTNRLVVSFNGDSIIGSQLDNITKSDEYLTGAFPPNMSKMIMARQFLDDYQFDDADVVYRNIIHSDWVKSSGAFAISNGKDEPSKTFNEIEVYGTAAVNDYAEITFTGYKYFKLIWSEYSLNPSKFRILCSKDGGAFNPMSGFPEYVEVTASGSHCMQKYAIRQMNPASSYTIRIIATENPNNILFWGCEMWNNPRLDVVVEAYSGSRAISQVRTGQLEAYHSDWHTPALVVSDILSINDYSYIVGSDETIDQWMTSNKTLYNRVIDNGIALLLFTPWQSTDYLTKNAVNVARQNNLPYIDIQKKQTVLPPSSAIYGPDGTHLSDYGNTYFYDELKRVLNDE